MVLPQFHMTKIKLEYLKFGLSTKKIKTQTKKFCINRVRPFSNSAQVSVFIRPYSQHHKNIN